MLSDQSVTSMAISVGGMISSILNVKYSSAMSYILVLGLLYSDKNRGADMNR